MTSHSHAYQQLTHHVAFDESQEIFSDFEMRVIDATVPPESVQQSLLAKLDQIWEQHCETSQWIEDITKSDVRSVAPADSEMMEFVPVGSIKVASTGNIMDECVTFNYLKRL